MNLVSVTELKARLSHYLRVVKRGGEVQVLERGVPVARLVGIGSTGVREDERRQRLVESGVIRAGTGNASWVLEEEPIRVRGRSLSEALEEVREDRL